jgi:hypothetical protein
MAVTELDDRMGRLDGGLENLPASPVGTVVDYLTRLANVRTTDVRASPADTFWVTLEGALRIAE